MYPSFSFLSLKTQLLFSFRLRSPLCRGAFPSLLLPDMTVKALHEPVPLWALVLPPCSGGWS